MLDEKVNNLDTENLTEESTESHPDVTATDQKENELSKNEVIESTTLESTAPETTSPKATASKIATPEIVNSETTAEKTAAPKSEKEQKETSKNADTDFGTLDLDHLVSEFQKLMKQETIPNIKNKVEAIKLNFNKKFGALLTEKKEAFVKEGGNTIDFHFSSPIKSTYNDLLFEYKIKRDAFYKQIEKEQTENLAKRLELIESLKHLIDTAEPATMYKAFRVLQDKWRTIGKIPRAKYNDTWRTYHHHVERFYDLLHLSNDFRDLDFKHNLEEKLKLVTKAEALAESENLNKAFKELQVLHRLWKEDIGPVAREFREEIWQRFSKATKKIHDNRHELQKKLEFKYEDNVIEKRAIIEKIANIISTEEIKSHKLWQQKIKILESLRQDFFKIGKVPRALNEKIWKEFKEATRDFNKQKNSFYKKVKSEQYTNLKKKNELVEKAESLKDSEDFDGTTDIMKQIQAEWKTIGHVPRKYSDKIWNQFKDSCNHYFDRLHNKEDAANKDQIEAFEKKKTLLENIKSLASNEKTLTLDVINSYLDDWKKLGSLPNNMRHVETKFNKTLDVLYGKLDMDVKEIALLKFKNNINSYLTNNNLRKIDNEQLFIRKKMDEIVKETQQLENNVSFFANTDESNPLLKNVHDNIQNHNKELEIWKTKLDYLTNLDY